MVQASLQRNPLKRFLGLGAISAGASIAIALGAGFLLEARESSAASKAAQGLRSTYKKLEYRIQMRDGKKLYTAVYVPIDTSQPHPMLLERTPYSAGPYGPDTYPRFFGGSTKFQDAGYIFVFQDVRGRFMSEGKFEEIRPQLRPDADKNGIDESTDAWDTVDFLVKNVPNNNGRIGVWGISYPGFYASTAALSKHPAIKAVSPQAPVADWFVGDDVHHGGAFFLQDNFDFYFWFGYEMEKPAEDHPQIEPMPDRPDAYKFFLDLGNASNADKKYFKGRFPFWKEICEHPDMDEFWQIRSVPPKLKGLSCAVLNVGGWFDAEDLYGTLETYRRVEAQNSSLSNWLVMGPWSHGQWAEHNSSALGNLKFGSTDTGKRFRDEVEFPFFDAYLRGDGKPAFPEAQVFDTGANEWRSFTQWPPAQSTEKSLYFGEGGKLRSSASSAAKSDHYDQFVSDPKTPVPYHFGTIRDRPEEYMVGDQRFASARRDVLTYQTDPLEEPITLAGGIVADLKAMVSAPDCDFIVKIIDVFPKGPKPLGNAQILVRGDVLRGRYRDSLNEPRPFRPGRTYNVSVPLNDLFHTFQKGHRIMVQVQASWFPLVDRNPQTWVNPYFAKPTDYKAATIRIFRNRDAASRIRFRQLE